MKLEEDYKTDVCRGSSTRTAYSVEARYMYPTPKIIAKQIFDKTWRRVTFEKGAKGVPPCNPIDNIIIDYGLYSYNAAQALRWWFISNADYEQIMGSLCIETRLVSHQVKTNYEVTALECSDHVGKRKSVQATSDD